MSGTRRIENPHYGMVVTDGVAARVFMLIAQEVVLYPETLVWWASRINANGTVFLDKVYLAPGEWAEVIE